MLTKYASAVLLSAEWVEQPAHAHDHTPWLQPQQRTFRTAHRHAFVYKKRPGYLYVRSRAISSRCNDNYDEFPAEEIKLGFRTFVGKPVFVNHRNDNHRRARGVVIDAALHEDTNPDGSPDTWCEVLMEVDARKFPKLAKAIILGHVDRTSMGTDVAYSKCSFCGNKASTPLEYCQHIPKLKGKRIRRTTASGGREDVLVREICYGLSFFENSLLVEEPADPTAFFLGVEGDGVTATTSPGVTEAMLRAAGPFTKTTALSLDASFAKLAAYERKTKTPEWDAEDEELHPRNRGEFSKAPGSGAAPAEDGGKEEAGDEAEGGDQAPTDKPTPKGPGEGTTSGTGTKEDPVQTDDVYAAAEALQQGKHVQLSQPKMVSTLLDRLSKVVKKAKEEGTEVKIDLCNVTVQGTNLFCVESKGIPRIKMPQLKSKQPKPGSRALKELKPGENGEYDIQVQFRQMLIAKGVTMSQETEKATFLKPSQSQLRGEKVAGMAGWIEGALAETGKIPEGERIFISSDNYIVDGHHRWAAVVGTDWADGQGDELEMDVDRVDMDIIALLDEANKFADEWGLPQLDLYDKPAAEQVAARLNQSFGSLVRTAAVETMTIPNFGTINYRSEDKARVEALLPYVQTGPGYRRGTVSNLRDYSLFVGRKEFDSAERYLLYAEGKTMIEAQEIIEGQLPFSQGRRLIAAGDWVENSLGGQRYQRHPYYAGVDPVTDRGRRTGEYDYRAGHQGGDYSTSLASGRTTSLTEAKRAIERAIAEHKRGGDRTFGSKVGYGEQKAPAKVDTLRDASCPVCGEENAYDAEKCLVCGFVKPPDTFMDPDLEQAKEVDLRQETDDTAAGSGGGGEKLVCDKCGFEVETDDLADQAPGGSEDPNAADPNANPFAKKDEEVDPNAPPEDEVDEEGKPKEVPKADDGKTEVDIKDGAAPEDDDDEEEIDPATGKPKKKKPKPPIKSNSKLAVLTALNIAGVRWVENGRVAGYETQRAYGVVDDEGRMLSTDGIRPSTWGTMAAAKTIAQYPPPSAKWITPHEGGQKQATAPPNQPTLKNPTLAHPPAQMDAPADGAGLESKDPQEEIPETTPQAGDTCPECGQGTLRPKAETAKLDTDKPEVGDEPDKKKSAPPWEKDEKSQGKEQEKKSSASRSGATPQKEQSMRPALAALAEQQQTINAQARQIKALSQGLKAIARLAGVEEHPKFVALMKVADENNPAQPIPDPPAEPAAQTTEEALGDLNDEDVEKMGPTGLTDVSADATTDVMSTEVVLDTPLDLNEQDPTRPVAGTEEIPPLADTKTETEVRAGNPNNPDTMFPLEGDFAQRATTGSREARTIAALRLARLRVSAGIAAGDDLALATAIAQSNVSDEVIQAEIGTLAKVMAANGQPQRAASRNLVPRAAARSERRPSLADRDIEAPPIQMVGSVEDAEILFE